MSVETKGDPVAIYDMVDVARITALRNEPVQARSAARLSGLLDAAARLIDEIGYERLTTAMVAERAGASIGTVYRYFPDRLAVLEGLSARSFRRFVERVGEKVEIVELPNWYELLDAVVDTYVEMYRHESGFRVIRFGDVVDVRLLDGQETNNSLLAASFARLLQERFGIVETDEVRFRLKIGIAIADSLVNRAFISDTRGDERFILEAKAVVRQYLASHKASFQLEHAVVSNF